MRFNFPSAPRIHLAGGYWQAGQQVLVLILGAGGIAAPSGAWTGGSPSRMIFGPAPSFYIFDARGDQGMWTIPSS